MMRVFFQGLAAGSARESTVAFMASFVFASAAFAGGFEEAVTWSGKQSGMGGYGVSGVHSSEAIYFNPAGLAYAEKGDVSANASPTFSRYEGPLRNGSALLTIRQNKGNRSLAPIFGATVSNKPNKNWGVAAGVYSVGTTKAVFRDLDYSQVSASFVFQPRASTFFSATEASIAAAYALTSRLSLGVGWRVTLIQAELWEPIFSGTSIFEVGYRDMMDVNYGGFRFGLLYKGDKFSIGWKLRTAISFTAEGRLGYQAADAGESIATELSGAGTDTSLSATFPLATEIGTHINLNKNSTLSFAYGYSKYSAVQNLVLTSTALGSSTTDLRWIDQHHLRVGFEHDQGVAGLPLRLGYVLNTAVVSRFNAKLTYSSPAPEHTLTVGTGYDFGPFEANFAFEYAFATAENATSTSGVVGDYQSNAFAFHSGLKYPF